VRVLLVINATIDAARERATAAARRSPRKDYDELRRALGADVLDLAALAARPWTRLARRLAGPALAQALLAWTLSRRYDAIYVDQETSGFALAALYRFARPGPRPRLTMIGHLLSPRGKQALVRALRLERTIDCVVVHSSLQGRLAVRTLGLSSERVALVPYQVDERFWSSRDAPALAPAEDRICSAGLEYRDYDTLVEAVAGLPVDVAIAAASGWSAFRFERGAGARPLPPNVRIVSLDYADLRELYASALFVVVPLRDVENQAGITTILEAMAMSKAVIVSHTRGQTDVVRDRRRASRADPSRETQPGWARLLGAAGDAAEGHTGFYVRPGDVAELRRAILFLLAHPEQARLMGLNGRRLVEETMGLDLFTARLAALIAGTPADMGGRVEADAPAIG